MGPTSRQSSSFKPSDIDGIFSAFQSTGRPGAVVGVALHGEPIFRTGYGAASTELPLALTPNIRLRVGSISKQFASLAFMLLVEQGRASLDAPIVQYLPELHEPLANVTMRHLLTHTGGCWDAYDVMLHLLPLEGVTLDSSEMYALTQSLTGINFNPNTSWCYNNGGYVLTTVVLERIYRTSLEHILKHVVFDPIGMYDTELRRSYNDYATNVATQHILDRGNRDVRAPGFRAETTAEGGVISNVDDMLRWLKHMDHPIVGSADTWKSIEAPQILDGGRSTFYGLGLFRGAYRGHETLYHSGSVMGGAAHLLKAQGLGLDIFVATNGVSSTTPRNLAEKIIDLFVNDAPPRPQYLAPPHLLEGTFRSSKTGQIVSFDNDDGQALVDVLGIRVPVQRSSEERLTHDWLVGIELDVSNISDREIYMFEAGTLERLDRVSADNYDNQKLTGAYRHPNIGVHAQVFEHHGGLGIDFSHPRFGIKRCELSPKGGGLWTCKDAVYRNSFITGWVHFKDDYLSFEYSSFRSRRILFDRVTSEITDEIR